MSSLAHSLCSATCHPQSKSLSGNQLAASAEAPGPADYNTAQVSSALAHNVARAAFSSKVARGFAPTADGVAPGQYDNPLQLAQDLKKRHTANSVFKSGSRRLDSSTTFTPGPGAYNAEDAEVALRYDWIAKAHTSAAFQAGTLDRFGRVPGKAVLDAEVGPGSYKFDSLADALDKKAGSSNVFRSKTTRADGAAAARGQPPGDVPGPAFYHPSSPDRQSHLLNANKKWL